MNMDRVFIRLHNGDRWTGEEIQNGKIEYDDFHIGSLYSQTNDMGVVSEVTIVPHSPEDIERSLPFFDDCDEYDLYVPFSTKIEGQDVVSWLLNAAQLGNSSEIRETVDPEEIADLSSEDKNRVEALFGNIVRSAQRLFERVERQEPVLVGYTDNPSGYGRNQGHSDDARLKDLYPVVRNVAHPPNKIVRKYHVAQQKMLASERSAMRITLSPEIPLPNLDDLPEGDLGLPVTDWPRFFVDVYVRPDSFPDRVEYFLGVAKIHENEQYNAVIDEDGSVTLTGCNGEVRHMKTNLMATKVCEGSFLAFWDDWYQEPQRYRIKTVQEMTS